MPTPGQLVTGVLAGSVAVAGGLKMWEEKRKRDSLRDAKRAAAEEEAEA